MGGGYLNNYKLTSNKKYIVLLLIFLIGFLTLYINTSYGLFKKKDYLTSIDFVAGTLDYKIENNNLVDNSINVNAGDEYQFTLNLTSLNTIDSKYELYYLINGKKIDNPDIEIGYVNESIDSVKGTITSNGNKQITVSIKNKGIETVTITFGCEGGLINNELVMAKGNSLDKLILSDDLIVAYTYVGNESEPERFPNKGEGYAIKSVTCDGMEAEWNSKIWGLTFSNITGKNIRCNFEIGDAMVATDYIMNLAKTNTHELRIDEHSATGHQSFATKEYRYWGKKPNNYVWFNNELWRIIGVFDVDDGSSGEGTIGKVQKRLKIIKNEIIGNYSWDSSNVSTNDGWGINEWSQASLMDLLNFGAYYNRTTGNCINNVNDGVAFCHFIDNGLTSEAKEMIGNAKWYLGATDSYAVNALTLYGNERGFMNGKYCTQLSNVCNDNVVRKSLWIGKVGLMYPSDYGYASDMSSCINVNLNSYDTSCKNTNWLLKNVNQWLLTPGLKDLYAIGVSLMFSNGNLDSAGAANAFFPYPVVYLLPDIKVIDGIGTEKQPFILSLN